MVQGRIEPSPAEQLLELRRSRDRYAALADRLHDSADPDLDPAEMLAREQNARRIAHAYEKSVTNSVVRMSSMDETHRFALPSLGMRTWLVIFVAISGLEGGVLLAHFRPQIFRLLPPQKSVAKLERPLERTPLDRTALAPAPPKFATPPPPQGAPAPVMPPVISSAAPPAPATPAPKPAASPIAPAPNAAAPPSKPVIAPMQAPPPQASTPAPMPAPVPIPSARPTSGPVISIPAAPPAPVTQPPPPASAAPPVAPPAAAAIPAPSPLAPPRTPAPAAPVLTRPEAIAGTHTLPPYPVESKRMGESGKTQMKVGISPQGTASECTVVISSGSARLDAAACNHVEARWRWKPATRDGQPVAATTAVTVVWSLASLR